MNEDERLREALLELDALRKREAERSRESDAILSALEAMTSTKGAADGIEALLTSIQGSISCDLVALFECQDDTLIFRNPSSSVSAGAKWVAPGLMTRRRRIVDLETVTGLWETRPQTLENWRSMLSVPLSDGDRLMVLAAFSKDRAAFDSRDADLLHRLATVASQAILQRALEQRSTFLAAVIDKSPVSVAIADVSDDMPLVYVNDAFVDMTGYSREEVIGSNCRFLMAEPPNSDIRQKIRQTVADRTDGTFLVRNLRKNGEEFWNDLRLFPIRDENDVVTQMVATQSDATARVTAEIDRDNARRRLEAALSATSEGFLVLGQTGGVRFANAEFTELFGNEIAQIDHPLSAESIAKLLGSPSIAKSNDPFGYLLKPFNREVRARHGKQVLLRGRPIKEGGVVLSATDITQTKVNERILRQRLAAIEMSQDGIAIGDPEGRVLHANPSLVALWGLADETRGLGRKWSSFYDVATQDRFSAEASDFVKAGVWRGDASIESKDGARIHDVSLSRVPDVGTVLLVRDVTERIAEEEDRNRLKLKLDRAQMQEHLSQVSAGLAHDFNNLLSAIMGSATLIDGLDQVPDVAKTAAGRISIAAERAAGLVDGFLDLGFRERSAEKIDLGAMLATTVDLAKGGAPINAMLTTSLPTKPIVIEASQTDLLQIVMNLVVNGIDALEGQSGEVRVSLKPPTTIDPKAHYVSGTVMPSVSYAAIIIEDTGKGMDKETIGKMLDPYFTTKGNEGTGLGLAIVLSMLSSNGCLLGLSTKIGAGSKFTVYWPVDLETIDVQSQRDGQSRVGLPIMVVDDQQEVAEAIAADLTNAGFEVAETSDPEAALEAIQEDPSAWACLITDYDMPGLTGGDLVAQLAQSAPEVPVIVVSALARRLNDNRVRAASAVLSKPVKAATLIEAVNKALNAQEQEAIDANSSRG